MRSGNLLGNHRQRPITLALVLEPALAHEDCMGVSVLVPVYGWFTEGFDTPVVQEAKALLEELAA